MVSKPVVSSSNRLTMSSACGEFIEPSNHDTGPAAMNGHRDVQWSVGSGQWAVIAASK